MKILKSLLAISILITSVYGTGLYASTSKSAGLESFLTKELQTIQDLFEDQSQNFFEDELESDFKISGFSVKVTGMAAVELPHMAELEFRPSVEVYFKPQ
jgi:hypothetical protein